VAVSVALAVGASVKVAALGNRNDLVKVFDTPGRHGSMSFVSMATMRSSKSTPRSNNSASISFIEPHYVEMRGAFHRRASGDRIVLCLIGPCCTTAPFGDVLWDRLRGAPELVCQVGVAFWESPTDAVGKGEELDRTLVHV
jgi:hypothetical protein